MILSFETTGATSHVGLYQPDGTPVSMNTWDSGRELADQLPGVMLVELEATNAGLQSLTGVIIYSGPGSFTSLRIGHTVANALALSLGIPIVGATGSKWVREAIGRLDGTPIGTIAMPFYGAEANITRRKA